VVSTQTQIKGRFYLKVKTPFKFLPFHF